MKYFIHDQPAVILFSEQHKIGAEIVLREEGLGLYVHDESVREDFVNFIDGLIEGGVEIPARSASGGQSFVTVQHIPLDERTDLRKIGESMRVQGYPSAYTSTPLRNILHFVCARLSSTQLAENLGTYLSLTTEEEIELFEEMKQLHGVLESERPILS